MQPLLLVLVLTLESLNCLGISQHRQHRGKRHAGHHSGHTSSAGGSSPQRYPQYMMQLYRDYRAVDMKTAAREDGDALHQTDSVLSLVAKGRIYTVYIYFNITDVALIWMHF